MAHNYHPNCGCYSCCQQEARDEQADELAVSLHQSGNLLSEALGELSPEQWNRAASLAADNDDLALGELIRRAVDRYIDEQVETRMVESGLSRIEAVDRMLTVYEVKRRPQPKLMQVAA